MRGHASDGRSDDVGGGGTALRRGVVLALLGVVAVWPLVHHVLVRTLDLDPWCFFGWAMYSTPNMRVNVRAARLDEGSDAPDWNAISPRAWRWMREYGERAARFGRLADPDPLARRIFESQPELPGLLIRVRRFGIDPVSSRITARDTDYSYAPPGSRTGVRVSAGRPAQNDPQRPQD